MSLGNGLAGAIFDAQYLQQRLEDVLLGALGEFFDRGEAEFKRFDYYDSSVEFWAKEAAVLDGLDQAVLWVLGFSRAWVCYRNGPVEETYYSPLCSGVGKARAAQAAEPVAVVHTIDNEADALETIRRIDARLAKKDLGMWKGPGWDLVRDHAAAEHAAKEMAGRPWEEIAVDLDRFRAAVRVEAEARLREVEAERSAEIAYRIKQHDRADAAEAKVTEWRRALQDLTPGGSEFQTPAECLAYARQVRDAQHASIVRFKLRGDVAEAKLAEVERERDEYRERLQFDPGGSDAIDALEMGLQFSRSATEAVEAQVRELRAALEEIADGNMQSPARRLARRALARIPGQEPSE